MSTMIVVSFVIVTFNGREFAGRCLGSVFERTRDVEFEVVVVDNASSDGTPEMIAAEFPQVRLVRRTTNSGFASGVNEGIDNANGRTLFIMNPDAELANNALPPMLAYLDQHRDVALAAPKLLDAEGTVQLSCRAFPDYRVALFNRYSLLTKILPNNAASAGYLMTDVDHNATTDVDWVSGAAWLLPRATIDRIGKLDEAYFWSIEDVDYCRRIRRAGLRVAYIPEAIVVHRIGGSSATAQSRAIVARHRGMWRYYNKFMRPNGSLRRAAVDLAIAAGIGLRCSTLLIANKLRSRA